MCCRELFRTCDTDVRQNSPILVTINYSYVLDDLTVYSIHIWIFIYVFALYLTLKHVCAYRERMYTSLFVYVCTYTSLFREKWNLWHDTFIHMYFRDACIHTCDMMVFIIHSCLARDAFILVCGRTLSYMWQWIIYVC